MNLFITNIYRDPLLFFSVIIAVGFSVCLHEFCHAWMAKKCGDTTAADAGHLTLNPLKQMGIISIIMLLLLGFCWGAVPVNNHILSKRQRIAVSLAGPGVKKGYTLEKGHLTDIAPTLAQALSLSLPQAQGTPFQEIFE